MKHVYLPSKILLLCDFITKLPGRALLENHAATVGGNLLSLTQFYQDIITNYIFIFCNWMRRWSTHVRIKLFCSANSFQAFSLFPSFFLPPSPSCLGGENILLEAAALPPCYTTSSSSFPNFVSVSPLLALKWTPSTYAITTTSSSTSYTIFPSPINRQLHFGFCLGFLINYNTTTRSYCSLRASINTSQPVSDMLSAGRACNYLVFKRRNTCLEVGF